MYGLPEVPTPPADLAGLPEDWVYRDIPWASVETWGSVISAMPDGSFKLLAMSERNASDGTPVRRGQLFISPEGMTALESMLEKEGV